MSSAQGLVLVDGDLIRVAGEQDDRQRADDHRSAHPPAPNRRRRYATPEGDHADRHQQPEDPLLRLERQRPAPLTDSERRALKRLAADLARVWDAPTTTDRDRKQLLRSVLDEIVLTVDRDQHHARVELFWQGDAHTELAVALNRTPAKRTNAPENLTALIRGSPSTAPTRRSR